MVLWFLPLVARGTWTARRVGAVAEVQRGAGRMRPILKPFSAMTSAINCMRKTHTYACRMSKLGMFTSRKPGRARSTKKRSVTARRHRRSVKDNIGEDLSFFALYHSR